VLTCINNSYIVNSWARRKPNAQETADTKMFGRRQKDFGKMGSKSNHGSSSRGASPNHFEMPGGRGVTEIARNLKLRQILLLNGVAASNARESMASRPPPFRKTAKRYNADFRNQVLKTLELPPHPVRLVGMVLRSPNNWKPRCMRLAVAAQRRYMPLPPAKLVRKHRSRVYSKSGRYCRTLSESSRECSGDIDR